MLSNSLRERLIQGVTQRRSRLLRDKEQLDIADTNALLLNPNQFSIGHPSSPGGPNSNRKTRHTRLRPGEQADDNGNTATGDQKRRRKMGFDDNDSGSPAPLADFGSSTPFRDAHSKQVYSQFEAPIYSIDRLFTEKELALNMSRAHVATTDFFAKLKEDKMNENNDGNHGVAINGARGTLDAQEEQSTGSGLAVPSVLVVGSGDVDADAGVQGSPGMAPQQIFHATRAAHRANPPADFGTASAVIPPYAINISAAASKANPSAPPLPGLSESEATSDVRLMRRGANDPVYESLLERSCGQYSSMVDTALWRGSIYHDDASTNGLKGVESAPGPNAASVAMAMGGIPMSRTTSAAVSDMGAAPAGRSISTVDGPIRRRR